MFLKMSQNSQENTWCRNLSFNKVAGGACNFIKKRDSDTGVFCEFGQIFKNTFLWNTPDGCFLKQFRATSSERLRRNSRFKKACILFISFLLLLSYAIFLLAEIIWGYLWMKLCHFKRAIKSWSKIIFVSAIKKVKNTTRITFFHNTFMFFHIKKNIYKYKTKFASHEQYLQYSSIRRTFRNAKKTQRDQNIQRIFLTLSERKRPGKHWFLQCLCYWYNLLQWMFF